MPDFFHGKPLDMSLIPPDTEEKKKTMHAFLTGPAGFPTNVAALLDVQAAAAQHFSSVRKWGTYGLCWGGKVTVLAGAATSPFRAAATAHPGRLAVDDLTALTVPYLALLSHEDDDAETVAAYMKTLNERKDCEAEIVEGMYHGWMGARARLGEDSFQKAYAKGYEKFAAFFAKHLA